MQGTNSVFLPHYTPDQMQGSREFLYFDLTLYLERDPDVESPGKSTKGRKLIDRTKDEEVWLNTCK